MSIALAALVATFAIIPSLGRVFIPEFQEKSLVNSMMLFPGVSGYDESGKHDTFQVAPG